MANIFESPEIVRAFIGEVEEQLQLLENNIVELEQNGETTEIIQELLRVAHTLKGSSATMGFEEMKTLTHEMENVMDRIRSGLLEVSGPVINVLFECLDCLRMLEQDFATDKNNIKTEITPVITKLNEILSVNKPGDSSETAENIKAGQTTFVLDAKQ